MPVRIAAFCIIQSFVLQLVLLVLVDFARSFSIADKTWLPVAGGYEMLNVEVQRAEERSHLKVYQSLASLRQGKAFRYGRYESLALNNDVFVLRRWYKGEVFLVLVNMRDTDYVVDLTYFENIGGSVSVVVRSIQSQKNEGDIFDAASLPVAGFESMVLKVN